MVRYRILCLLCLALLAGCTAHAAEITATPQPEDEQATLAPTPSAAPTPSPTPTPVQPQWDGVNLGVALGDAYQPMSLGVDPSTGLVVVYSADSPEGSPAVSVVDSASGLLAKRTLLSLDDILDGSGKLLIAPDGQAYLLIQSGERLYHYNLATGVLDSGLDDVWDAHLTPAGLLVEHNGSLALYTPDLSEVLFALPIRTQELAFSADRLLVQQRTDTQEQIVLYDLTNGVPLAAMDTPGYLSSMAPGPDGGWFLAVDEDAPALWKLDRDLQVTARMDGLWNSQLFYDAGRARLVVSGYEQSRGTPYNPHYFLRSLNADSLATAAEQPWPDWRVPNLFAADADSLFAVREYGDDDRLYRFNPLTLAEKGRTILGVRLQELVLDTAQDVLFVADNQERIHRVALASGEVTAIFAGASPLSLDSANGRLYANRLDGSQRRVVALDSGSGAELARFPSSGVPAPDPQRDLVYITANGVSVYDRAGVPLGRLESTFPVVNGFSPNPYAFRAVVNPVSGGLVVFENNGVPGSNNRNFAVLYPPPDASGIPPNEPIDIPNPDSVRPLVTFDTNNGDTFLTHDGFRSITVLQCFDVAGARTAQLFGRTGSLLYDSLQVELYVFSPDAVAQLTSDLQLDAIFHSPEQLESPVLDEVARRVYHLDGQAPRIRHFSLDELTPFTPAVGAPLAALPTGSIARLDLLEQADGSPLLFVSLVDGSFLRSQDEGMHWQRLTLTSLEPANLYPSQVGSTLYASGYGSHGGDGVLRSDDSGLTWTRIVTGLADLRSYQPLRSVDPARLYLATAAGVLQVWAADAQTWRTLPLPDNYYFSGDSLLLTPDGTLFLRQYQGGYRSTDGGETWEALPAQTEGVHTWAAAPDFAQDGRMYGLRGFERPVFVRSEDRGESWRMPDPGFTSPPTDDYHIYRMLAGETLYLSESTFDGLVMLYRSVDGGDKWQQLLFADALSGASLLQLDKAGNLWFVREGAVRHVDPVSLGWIPYAPPVEPVETATPTASATPPPTPTAQPACATPLSDAERQILANHPQLLCPEGASTGTFIARQPFQNGQMIWLGDERMIYVLDEQGIWQQFPDTWDESQPGWEPQELPPPGLLTPVRGFGWVWHRELGDASAPIGWATGPEAGTDATIQRWSGGLRIQTNDGWGVLLLADGRWVEDGR